MFGATVSVGETACCEATRQAQTREAAAGDATGAAEGHPEEPQRNPLHGPLRHHQQAPAAHGPAGRRQSLSHPHQGEARPRSAGNDRTNSEFSTAAAAPDGTPREPNPMKTLALA